MRTLVKNLGKQPVVVADINGFIINRIQFALLREALHIVDIGAATVEDVDTALKAGMGNPRGMRAPDPSAWRTSEA